MKTVGGDARALAWMQCFLLPRKGAAFEIHQMMNKLASASGGGMAEPQSMFDRPILALDFRELTDVLPAGSAKFFSIFFHFLFLFSFFFAFWSERRAAGDPSAGRKNVLRRVWACSFKSSASL